jgi:long-chain acyl-CoA synthetase
MQGYFQRSDLTDQVVAQGWFFTGDIGAVDERGLLYLRGREREEINKGGMKIHPNDIDAVAERYAHTQDVCSFAFQDPLHGENVGIAVVLKQAGDEQLRGLYDHLKLYLAKFQMPQRWYLVQEIPRTSRGKVNRAQVSEHCSGLKPYVF